MFHSSQQSSNLVADNRELYKSYKIKDKDYSDSHNRNVLRFKENTYLVPARSSLLLKRIKEIDMEKGVVNVSYTHLVWFNVKGLPA